VELDKSWYRPGDIVRGTVRLEYFFGKALAGAIVRVEPQGVTGRLDPLELTATPDGRAEFSFRLPGTQQAAIGNPFNDRLVLDVVARDTAGQELKRRVRTVVASEPMTAEVIPEAGTLIRGTSNIVYVLVRYPDGRPAKVRLAVGGREQEIGTNDLGVATLSLTPASESVDLTLRATDDAGLSVNKAVTLRCGSEAEAFAVRTDKAAYTAGETMTLTPLGAGNEPILVDLVKDGQTLLTRTLTPGRSQAIDLPPDVFGTIQLTAYRFVTGGVPVRRSQVIYVHPPQDVRLAVHLDKGEYRPGQRARLNVSLSDSAGKPVAGAVSLSAVDEAVFSVLDSAPGMERTFFTLEQELLKPVYAVYDWSPDASSASDAGKRQEYQLLNKALFARTAMVRGVGASADAQRLVDQTDLDPRVFEALNRPDAEQLLANSGIDDSLRARILAMRGAGVAFTTSYPEKAARVEQLRRRGNEVMGGVWVGLGIAAGIFVLLLLARRIRELVIVILLVALLWSILMPSLNRARETANRVKAASDLRQIGQALLLSGNELQAKGNSQADTADVAPRLRQWFPETLLWRPELITDDAGHASLDVDLADSITTWRLSASAVTAGGQLGAGRSPIRVFQPFFVDLDLPVALVRGDEVAVPVAVYNYLDRAQTVELVLTKQPWFELLDDATKRLTLAKGEVRSVSYRIRATKVGAQTLTATAKGDGGVGDAVKRDVEVVPDGRKVEFVWNGALQGPATMQLAVPADAVEGSAKALVKIYPSSFSQLVEGIDGIFQRPYGCFEQTSSTTYPNVLALDYLRRTKKNAPEVEAKAKQYIHLGYQRLVGFEVGGGGFDWFGRPPANRVLTAYGLMEFEDMARVHEVDSRLIARTRAWLLDQRNPDGWWGPEGHAMHDDPTVPGAYGEQILSTTAYVAGAVFANGSAGAEAAPTRTYLLRYPPAQIADPYVLALVANALLEIDKSAAEPYVRQLDALKRTSADGKLVWWERPAGRRTVFYGAGQSGAVETTALAALAALKHGGLAATARGALTWLVTQRDASGTWHSTQATVLALRALLAGTSAPLGRGQARRVELTVGGEQRELVIPADQDEVMKQLDLSQYLRAGGTASLELREPSGTAVGYQVSFRYHVPGPATPDAAREPLGITLSFERDEVPVGQTVRATARVTNRRPQDAPMVIVDLPVPAGFSPDEAGLAALRTTPGVDKVQVTPRSLVVYLRELPAGKSLELTYGLRAGASARVTVPAAEVYEYYDPARRAVTPPHRLIAVPGV
jgi:uncharacterized protein YfaS (alpha-2-macroglobulin family)